MWLLLYYRTTFISTPEFSYFYPSDCLPYTTKGEWVGVSVVLSCHLGLNPDSIHLDKLLVLIQDMNAWSSPVQGELEQSFDPGQLTEFIRSCSGYPYFTLTLAALIPRGFPGVPIYQARCPEILTRSQENLKEAEPRNFCENPCNLLEAVLLPYKALNLGWSIFSSFCWDIESITAGRRAPLLG